MLYQQIGTERTVPGFLELTAPLPPIEQRPFDAYAVLEPFSRTFSSELALFERVGIHPLQVNAVLNPYTGERYPKDLRNIGEHCLAVGFCALRIATALLEAGIIDEAERDLAVSRALIHDINKPFEIMRRDVLAHRTPETAYLPEAYDEVAVLLLRAGYSETVANSVRNAGTEVGHNSLEFFVRPDHAGNISLVSGHLAAKITHLADDMTFTGLPDRDGRVATFFLAPWERMVAAGFTEKYPFLWKGGLVMDSDCAAHAVDDIRRIPAGYRPLGSYVEVQLRVAHLIATQLASLIDWSDERPPMESLRDIVNRNRW